jgi:hypothetical protein
MKIVLLHLSCCCCNFSWISAIQQYYAQLNQQVHEEYNNQRWNNCPMKNIAMYKENMTKPLITKCGAFLQTFGMRNTKSR